MATTKPISLNYGSNSLTFDSMINSFYDHFKVVVANTSKLREEVYRIRHKVYCQELNYEAEENCWNGMEQDMYDGRSLHCLLQHRSSKIYAGCVRLILADPYASEATFPFEKFYRRSLKPNSLSPYRFGEISRLAITAEFRKRNVDQVESDLSSKESFTEDERRYFPLIALGLYLAATSLGQEAGLDSAFTLMEPRLARHLRRFGINCAQIGELVEFHGQRGLFQIALEEVLSSMSANTYKLFRTLSVDIRKSLISCTPNVLRHRAQRMYNAEPTSEKVTLYRQLAVLLGR